MMKYDKYIQYTYKKDVIDREFKIKEYSTAKDYILSLIKDDYTEYRFTILRDFPLNSDDYKEGRWKPTYEYQIQLWNIKDE